MTFSTVRPPDYSLPYSVLESNGVSFGAVDKRGNWMLSVMVRGAAAVKAKEAEDTGSKQKQTEANGSKWKQMRPGGCCRRAAVALHAAARSGRAPP